MIRKCEHMISTKDGHRAIYVGTHIVVTSILHKRKKNNNLTAKEIALIEKVGGYQYEV